MFNVVYVVEDYPKFLPYCTSAIIHKKNNNVLETELFIGFPPLNERYCSRVTFLYPCVIRVNFIFLFNIKKLKLFKFKL